MASTGESREIDWELRGRLCRERLHFLRFLVGRWEGEGHSQGEAVRGRLEVASLLQDTLLRCEERLYTLDGALLHEDLALLRYDPESEQVRVLHFTAPAWPSEPLARPLPDGPGALWYGGPFAPRVELRPRGEELEIVVRLPEQVEPDTLMRYRRA